jgi:hypothetical protein
MIMKRLSIKRVAQMFCALLVTQLLLSACGAVPLTGRRQVLLVSDQEIFQAGLVQYNEYLAGATLSADKSSTQMVQTVGRKLADRDSIVDGNITCKIQGVVDLDASIDLRLCTATCTAEGANAVAVIAVSLGIQSLVTALAGSGMGAVAVVGVKVAVTQTGENLLVYQYGVADLADLSVGQAGARTGSRSAGYGNSLVSQCRDHSLRCQNLVTGGAVLALGLAGSSAGGFDAGDGHHVMT